MIQTRSASSARGARARPTAAASAAARALTPEDHRQPHRVRVPDDGERRGGRERRRGDHPVRCEPADRQHADGGREEEQPDGRRTQVVGARAGAPAGQRGGRRSDGEPEGGQGSRPPGPVRLLLRSSAYAGDRRDPRGRDEQVPGADARPVQRRVRRGSARRGGCAARARRPARRAGRTPPRRRRQTALAGTTRSRTPAGPWTESARMSAGACVPATRTPSPDFGCVNPAQAGYPTAGRVGQWGRDLRDYDASRHAAGRTGDADRADRAPAAAPDRAQRGRERRADERDPDAGQPRVDRAGGDDGPLHRRPRRSSRRACSCSRPSASSSCRSTGSASSARSR